MNTLVLAVALAAGALALWVDVRVDRLAPRSMPYAMLHTACAIAVLHALPLMLGVVVAGADSPFRKMLGVFVVLLPALIYAWLSTIWWLKLVQRAAHLR